jgi:TolB-like protein
MGTSLPVAASVSRQHLITPGGGFDCLDSWKQIAAFFARTPRTVQRWEKTESLPVYRHIHERVGSVYAFESELITWRDTRSRHLSETLPHKEASQHRLRLAVLPFANLSADPQLSRFEDGLTCEIIGQLARLDPPRLGVIARTSVMPYKKSPYNIAQIGRSLSVNYILEGSVRTAGRQLRIASQLINVTDQTHVFADACARRWTDSVLIQIAYAERIARMVSRHLLMGLQPRMEPNEAS